MTPIGTPGTKDQLRLTKADPVNSVARAVSWGIFKSVLLRLICRGIAVISENKEKVRNSNYLFFGGFNVHRNAFPFRAAQALCLAISRSSDLVHPYAFSIC